MTENSKIEWTHHTFNPWRGCTKVAEGCTNCYADTLSKRNPNTLGVWGPNGTRVMASESYWREPIKWNREAEAAGERRRVFCASLADVFEDWRLPVVTSRGEQLFIHADRAISARADGRQASLDDLRARLFALIDATPWLDWLLLTKRPENILRMWPKWDNGEVNTSYRCNVWLLTSIATQADADRNVPELLKCRDLVPVLGLSAEPLLGPVDLTRLHGSMPDGPYDVVIDCLRGWLAGAWHGRKTNMDARDKRLAPLDFVIVGGESGPHARPMHPDWARSIRDQCQAAGVPFFFKQWGEYLVPPFTKDQVSRNRQRVEFDGGELAVYRVGKKAAGRLLDGREWNEYPRPAEIVA